ncbi:unnamed protein product [Cylicocyclus nassatus]|uniref:Uncharacterized protein n=1 Tax=Cylicocyclus nassatus TaxID=53992 RepID=A0AA36GGD7_CYLNA|nr:unnamed protein product [Cylicocyclus nassatus]
MDSSSSELSRLKEPGYNSPPEPISRLFYLLYAIPFFVIVSYLTFIFVYRARNEEKLKKRAAIKPVRPKPGKIDRTNFEFRGPLRLQSKLTGEVQFNQKESEPSAPIDRVVYDENLNEIVDIGSDVEEIEWMSHSAVSTKRRRTTVTTSTKRMTKRNAPSPSKMNTNTLQTKSARLRAAKAKLAKTVKTRTTEKSTEEEK